MDFSHFDKELFDADLADNDFYSLADYNDVNSNNNRIIRALQEVTNKYAPIRKVSNSKKDN